MTLRILQFVVSAMYTLPELSTATPAGPARLAAVAALPSPADPEPPVPAIVATSEVPTYHLRTRLSVGSAMMTLPELSTAMPLGLSIAEE